MIRHRIVVYILFLLAFANISCINKTNNKISDEELIKESSESLIKKTLPDATIKSIDKIDQSNYYNSIYSLSLSDTLKLDFDKDGNWTTIENQEDKAIPISFLNTEVSLIQIFIKENYPDFFIVEINREAKKNYEVKLNNGIGLIFDSEQNFIGLDLDKNQDEVLLQAHQLPKNSLAYLHQHFADNSILLIKRSNTHTKEYCVYLKQQYKICFNEQGNWIAIESNTDKSIDFKLFIAPIENYIRKNHPNSKVTEANFSNNKYELELINNQDKFELKFDTRGNLLK